MIWYMGHKGRILEFIVERIGRIAPPGSTVLDVFSGTGVVGHALSAEHGVVANDVQAYGETLALCLLGGCWSDREGLDPDVELGPDYLAARSAALHYFAPAVDVEARLLADPWTDAGFEVYRAFCEGTPHVGALDAAHPAFGPAAALYGQRADTGSLPAVLFATYFASAYFSLGQAIEIDAWRYAVGRVEDPWRRALYLAALMSAACAATGSTSHFAEFRRPRTFEASLAVLRRRRVDIGGVFRERVRHLAGALPRPDREHAVYRSDWRGLFADPARFPAVGEASAIYVDPPYSPADYSRFYHVLETLVRYDYPGCRFDGRYRTDRFRSAFNRAATASAEMDALLAAAASRGMAAAVSYADSPTAVIPRDDLVAIARGRFGRVEVHEVPLAHSRQGRASALAVSEMLVLCERPL